MKNKVFKVLSEWKLDNSKVKKFVDYGFIYKQMYIFYNNINTVKTRLFQVSRNDSVLFISNHEGFPPLPQLP